MLSELKVVWLIMLDEGNLRAGAAWYGASGHNTAYINHLQKT